MLLLHSTTAGSLSLHNFPTACGGSTTATGSLPPSPTSRLHHRAVLLLDSSLTGSEVCPHPISPLLDPRRGRIPPSPSLPHRSWHRRWLDPMAGSPDPEVGRPDPTAALLPLPSLLTDPVGRGGEAGQPNGEAGPTPRQQRHCASAAADSGPVRAGYGLFLFFLYFLFD